MIWNYQKIQFLLKLFHSKITTDNCQKCISQTTFLHPHLYLTLLFLICRKNLSSNTGNGNRSVKPKETFFYEMKVCKMHAKAWTTPLPLNMYLLSKYSTSSSLSSPLMSPEDILNNVQYKKWCQLTNASFLENVSCECDNLRIESLMPCPSAPGVLYCFGVNTLKTLMSKVLYRKDHLGILF